MYFVQYSMYDFLLLHFLDNVLQLLYNNKWLDVLEGKSNKVEIVNSASDSQSIVSKSLMTF